MPVLYHVLGRNLRTARKRAELTQEQTAEALGMSLMNYGRLERGQRRISLDQLSNAAKVFECSVLTLLKGCFPEDVFAIYEETDTSVFSKRIIAIMEGCSEEELEMVYQIIRLIAYRRAICDN